LAPGPVFILLGRPRKKSPAGPRQPETIRVLTKALD